MRVAARLRAWFDGGLVANVPTHGIDELLIELVKAAEETDDRYEEWRNASGEGSLDAWSVVIEAVYRQRLKLAALDAVLTPKGSGR